jgi:nucleoside-diphosphate-sugar epimerase
MGYFRRRYSAICISFEKIIELMTGSTVFVTGGTGLLGSHLLYELSAEGYVIKALKRPTSNIDRVKKLFSYYSDNAEEMFGRIKWVDEYLMDYEAIRDILSDCDQAYHAAATVSFRKKDRAEMLSVNVQGTANMVNVCNDLKIPLCHVSSIGALGRGDPGHPVAEDSFWQSSDRRSAYSYSKYKSEMEVWRGIAEGLNAVIVNPAVILGPGNWEQGSSSFFHRIYRGMRFYTKGVTAFVDVRDVCRCMVQLMKKECFGERYILSAGELSYKELFDAIAGGLNVKKPSAEAKPWMLKTAYLLSSAIGNLTGVKTVLTKETVRSATQKLYYSNQKVTEALSYHTESFVRGTESFVHGTEPFVRGTESSGSDAK